MLTFKKSRIVFIVVMSILLASYFYFKFDWYYLLILPFLYSLLIAYGSAFIESGFFMKSYCKSPTSDKIISLSFDDGPEPLKSLLILDLLKEYNIKATFFVIGKKIQGNEEILKRINKEGHIIANHSFSHSYVYDIYPTSKVIQDLQEANESIRKNIGYTPKWFRPPYGVTNPNIARAVEELGLLSVGWNVRSLDTVIKDTDKLIQRVTSRIQPGSIILFHDTGSNTLNTLREVILFAQKNGYKIVGLDQLMNIKAYEEI